MRPLRIPPNLHALLQRNWHPMQQIALIREEYQHLRKQGEAQVSVVIPAYNEAENILPLLQSLTRNNSKYAVEIIVVNNNSHDNTEALLKASGVPYINEKIQGITAARNAGLRQAKGKFVINADADTLYPPTWIDALIDPLENDGGIAVSYGNYAFIPTGAQGRGFYFFYETIADVQRWFKRRFREEAVNVFGCNSAYRRQHGVMVDGYHHPPGANEDGYLALKLRRAGYGRLHFVNNKKALVWTPDSLIQAEGSMAKSIQLRIKKFFLPHTHVQMRTDL